MFGQEKKQRRHRKIRQTTKSPKLHSKKQRQDVAVPLPGKGERATSEEVFVDKRVEVVIESGDVNNESYVEVARGNR
jgi:hypothetical protein